MKPSRLTNFGLRRKRWQRYSATSPRSGVRISVRVRVRVKVNLKVKAIGLGLGLGLGLGVWVGSKRSA